MTVTPAAPETLPMVATALNVKNDAAESESTRRLVKFEELPEYMKDNEYITDYYRSHWSLKDIFLSVFSWHNETLNIWTHLIGFVIFLGLTLLSLSADTLPEKAVASFFGAGNDVWLKRKLMIRSNGSDAFFSGSYLIHLTKTPIFAPVKISKTSLPLWPWLVFLSGAMTCLIFSTISHLFACHSRSFYYFFWRLDYTGITIMIVCSFFAPIYYVFPDHPYWRQAYLLTIALVGTVGVITLLTPRLSKGRFRSYRAALFISMGFSGVVPATHAMILNWDQPMVLASLGYEALVGVLYGVGAAVYVARVPERWRPGAFDIVGQSHQIFHVFVVAAALAHAAATLMIMDWRGGMVV